MRLVRRFKSVYDYRIGDLVVLGSGGPVMAVFDIDYWGNLWCNWMSCDGLEQASFRPIMVRMARRPLSDLA